MKRIAWAYSTGAADLRRHIDADTSTVYWWYSLTKIVTATAIMQLAEKGLVDLDAPVRRYVPYFTPEPHARTDREAMVRHLLTHSSGLGDREWQAARWYRLESQPSPDPEAQLKDLLSKYHKLKSNPGEKRRYSNVGYALLGEIVARASGMPYREYVEQNILAPLGMSRTGFTVDDAMGFDVAVGYEKPWSMMGVVLRIVSGGGAIEENDNGLLALKRLHPRASSYAGLIGPANDLARFVIAHTNDGACLGRRILSAASTHAMQEPQLNSKGEYLRALGWYRVGDGAAVFVGHRGGGPGFRCEVRIYPEKHLAVVVLGNRTFDSWPVADLVAANERLFTVLE